MSAPTFRTQAERFMTKIYCDSLRFFLTSLPGLLAFAATIEVMLWVLQPRSEGSVTFAALTLVAYYFHRHFLFGENLTLRMQPVVAKDAPPIKLGWFMVASAALVAVPVGAALGIAIQYSSEHVLGIMGIVLVPLYLLVLSLFGTVLPATVARDGSYRLSQGVRATFATMWRLVLGPGVVGFVFVVATLEGNRVLAALVWRKTA
jgi:hypothetical protein